LKVATTFAVPHFFSEQRVASQGYTPLTHTHSSALGVLMLIVHLQSVKRSKYVRGIFRGTKGF
jgi:hypothetical protein